MGGGIGNDPFRRTRVGAHPDHWYPLAWSEELRPGRVIGREFAGRPIALYRGKSRRVFALEDRCAHRQVPLHLGIRAEVKYGLKPWQALQTATLIPARAFGYGKDLGSLEPGKLADLDIIEGNPLENIDDTINVKGVIVNGRYYTQEELAAPFQH